MAFDGIVVANLVHELNEKLSGGRITKISQPEKDELILTIKNYDTYKLFLSASASLPLVYLTESTKPNPMTAPNFCMLLRKHLNSARILSITQPELERIIDIKIEHLDEMGDLRTKHLLIEIMGKHSNIIFCDEDMRIVDSIKHVSGAVSSVREVLPGRDYFIPKTQEKINPLTISYEEFQAGVLTKPLPTSKALYQSLTGISPLIANEICHEAGIDAEQSISALSEDYGLHLYHSLVRMMEQVHDAAFTPCIVYRNNEPIEFSSVPLHCYTDYSAADAESSESFVTVQQFDTVSEVLENFYSSKNKLTRIRQKSADLRKIVATAIERDSKKYDLQLKQLEDTEKREKYRIYGELLTTYGYNVTPGEKSVTVLNYYTNEDLTIPLDPDLSAIDNAKRYFDKYAKLKRTHEALTTQTAQTHEELEHLDSIRTALDIAVTEDDLVQLKEEMMDYGYIKRHYLHEKNGKKPAKKVKITSRPFHYISSDGYDMYVGKNNYQNDELTFRFASGNDWWFHAKGIPGSHVIVKSKGEAELPDRVYEEAGSLAAYYSKGRDADKVEIDYAEKRNIKKPTGGKPGFVVYYTNYSLMATPDIQALTLIE